MYANLLNKLYKQEDLSSTYLATFDSSMAISSVEEADYTLASGGPAVTLVTTKGLIIYSSSVFSLAGDIVVDANQFFAIFAPMTVSLSNPGTVSIDCKVFMLS